MGELFRPGPGAKRGRPATAEKPHVRTAGEVERELVESRAREAALAEVLRVMSRTPLDLQAVLDTVVQRAAELCGADRDGGLYLIEGDRCRFAAGTAGNLSRDGLAYRERRRLPSPIESSFIVRNVVGSKKLFHVRDAAAEGETEQYRRESLEFGMRTCLGVPLMREGEVVGVLSLSRKDVRPFAQQELELVRAFADQAAIAIESARLQSETKESLEQQTALADVLAVMSRTPIDLQAVLDTVVERAAHLCDAKRGAYLYLAEGDRFRLVATTPDARPNAAAWREQTRSVSVEGSFVIKHVVESKEVFHVRDATVDGETQAYRQTANDLGYRSMLGVPLIRSDEVVGVLSLQRADVRAFSDREIALVRAFADQAAIAVENARMFTETKEGLERQTAVAEVLGAISRSAFDLDKVLKTIVENAIRLADADNGAIRRVTGESTELMAWAGTFEDPNAQSIAATDSLGPGRATLTGRVLLDRRTVQIEDVEADPEYDLEGQSKGSPSRTVLGVPLLLRDELIGVLIVRRNKPRPFTPDQIRVTETFADQAAIAMDNVRLFTETKEALERQTAISEILKVISASPTEIQPVLDAIAENAAKFCAAEDAVVMLAQDTELRVVAHTGPVPIPLPFSYPIDRQSMNGRAFLERRTLSIPDISAAHDEYPHGAEAGAKYGWRAGLVTPLVRGSTAIGTIALRRMEVRPFSEKQIDLLRTFADQAVIAIENVRLFNETKEALERQTATSEVLRVISNSAFELEPVFESLIEKAVRLGGADNGSIVRRAGDKFVYTAHAGTFEETDPLGEGLRRPEAKRELQIPWEIRPGREQVSGRVLLEGRTVQIPDILEDREYVLQRGQSQKVRAILGVPILRGRDLVGIIILRRVHPGAFDQKRIELVESFAHQAAIAIDNARLFNETKESLERQTATADVLRLISRSAFELGTVLDSVLETAARLCAAQSGVIFRLEPAGYRPVAALGLDQAQRDLQFSLVMETPNRGNVIGRAILDRAPVQIEDALAEPGVNASFLVLQEKLGFRTLLGVPILRDGEPIGVMSLRRNEVRPFTSQEVDLVTSFADQAAIAIENVRLFNETKEALEQQTATAEVLDVISRSATDLGPVFQTIVEKALRLCEGDNATILRREGDAYRGVASAGFSAEESAAFQRAGPLPLRPGPGSLTGRVLLQRRSLQIADVRADPEYDLSTQYATPAALWNVPLSLLGVPMLRGDDPIGVIVIRRHRVGPFSDKQIALVETFAAQAVIAIENVRLFNETREALERQTAMSEILRVISRSPTDIQPVLETIAESAARFCASEDAGVVLVRGAEIHLTAHYGPIAWTSGAYALDTPSVTTKAIREGRTLHVADMETLPDEEFHGGKEFARQHGYRAFLAAPLLREGRAIGVIQLRRREPAAFTQQQVELVETFAAQAVIAMENVRLFNETKEALEQQTAVADVLATMSRSVFDLEPLLESVVENAVRLSGADFGFMYREEAPSDFRLVAKHGRPPAVDLGQLDPEGGWQLVPRFTQAIPGAVIGRAFLERRTIHVEDVQADAEYSFHKSEIGDRTNLAVPLLASGKVVGVLGLWRYEVRAFTAKEIALVETFARQAAIAIENVRLFKETKEALEQQTATADVLKVISRTTTDLKPVLETVVALAARLCGADSANIARLQDDNVAWVAGYGPSGDELVGDTFQIGSRLGDPRVTVVGRVWTERQTVQILDALQDPDWLSANRDLQEKWGWRTLLGVPMFRERELIGVLSLRRNEVAAFTDKQIQVLEVFAAQAAIAIENVRLFNETKEALERQTATAEVLKVISESPSDLQPVFDSIGEHARVICEADLVHLWLLKEDRLELAGRGRDPETRADLIRVRSIPVDRTNMAGRAVLGRTTIHNHDVLADPEYDQSIQEGTRPWHTTLAVPLMRAGEAIGAIALLRGTVRPFEHHQIELVQTFADQAAIAIENVRLFNETKESLDQQTATSEVLQVISRSAFDLQRVLDTLVENATRLSESRNGFIFRLEGERYRLVASHGASPEFREFIERNPILPGRETLVGRTALEGKPVHIPDVLEDPEYKWTESQRLGGFRTMLGLPMLREGQPIGVIAVWRDEVRPFTDRQMQLLTTFADQAVIAIENVRLFNETTEALERQTAIGEVLRSISSSPTDAQPVLDVVALNAARFCGAEDAGVLLLREQGIVQAAHHGSLSWWLEPLPVDTSTITGRAVIERRTVQVADLQAEADAYPFGSDQARRGGYRTTLATPLLRENRALGAILLRRTEVKPFSDKQVDLVRTFADQAAIAIENVRLFNETNESLERQTAIADVLGAMSNSPTDVQPVLETISRSAARICGANYAGVMLLVDDHNLVAHQVVRPGGGGPTISQPFPVEGSVSGRAIRELRAISVDDLLASDDFPVTRQSRLSGPMQDLSRSALAVPLVRQGRAIGTIFLRRAEMKPFTENEIDIVRTFADQAVIAIENVRLFNETKESLDRQTAVAEVLKTISRSVFDLQPVLDVVLENAVRLAEADIGWMSKVDGERFKTIAYSAGFPAAVREELARDRAAGHLAGDWRPFGPEGGVMGTVLGGRTMVHLHDARVDPVLKDSLVVRLTESRTVLGVPMLREGRAIGGVVLARYDVRPFSDRETELVQTFSDQAAIAIENVRLFDETREALERQTAIGEVLKVISGAAFDLHPVLDTVVEHAARLCEADLAWLVRREEAGSVLRARYGATPELAAILDEAWPEGPEQTDRRSFMSRVYGEKRTIHLEDITKDPAYENSTTAMQTGSRTVLGVPIMREGEVLGGLALARVAVRAFNEREVQVVQTFADQAAIAIENVRLFNEIQEKSRQLEVASRHKSEFLATMSHELRTPLNAIIGFSEVLLQGMFGGLNEKQTEYLNDVLSSGRLLLSLINDILDLSKIEAGRMELDVDVFSLREALQNGITMVRERAARHQIALSLDVAEDVDTISADARKVKQVVFNLLSNAVKFTPDGGRVAVTAVRQDGDVVVAVRDTGIGIAPEDADRIFVEFQQARRQSERSREGTGLGLALSKRFVELHGGRIWFESTPGSGSTFAFALPLRAPAAGPAPAT